MTEVEKPAWPKTPDGTIDWEVVFEDSESGVVTLLMAANSPASLHKCAEVVVRQLFTRKNDEQQVDNFLGELEIIIAEMGEEGNFENTQASVISLLRRIKSGRIRRAEAYIKQKQLDSKGRREGESPGIFGFLFGTTLGRLITSGTVVVFLGGTALIVMLTLGDNAEQDPFVSGSAATSKSVEPESKAVEERASDEPEEVDHRYYVVLEAVIWPFTVTGGRTRPTPLLPVVELSEETDWEIICAQSPKIRETINRSLTRHIPDDVKTTDSHLARATGYAENKIIEYLHDVGLENFSLMRYPPSEMVSKSRSCQLLVQ
ncbi:MAG: hypothetical protein HN893_16210 [Rhodospirillales bacterium]|nr:hypothetical protein [Rhodospirillales bacterium]